MGVNFSKDMTRRGSEKVMDAKHAERPGPPGPRGRRAAWPFGPRDPICPQSGSRAAAKGYNAE